ncbi:glycosyltransferase family 2 protein [Crocosphaera chwakensis]|uniref:Glycosyl transferase, group 2 family protein n=1 Tax=Crocosphaera chwakensis CCY0110 TaxID=391612 RepID=A3IQN3_9CHRO|nr:glycosyltransferase family 2 protein [Crocosphaera chwakensis]EAZ91308.1 glycosyl transferase, group 2 family protein [Crocosphaera chwakensis CCY0110]
MIAVVIPCFRVSRQILGVISGIGEEIDRIYVVDDHCPEYSGQVVRDNSIDPRVQVIFLSFNQGVGGATIAGIQQAVIDGASVIVKMDGDGQMESAFIPALVKPIVQGEADYTKGNRFFYLDGLLSMPTFRLIGNAGLSFLSKLSSGYWNIFDPTNGFFAIEGKVASVVPWRKINKRFFFESDLLFRLNIIQAKVIDIPMPAIYEDEISNLNPWRELPRFFTAHLHNFSKRIFYNYILRNFSIASIELLLSLPLLIFGILYGLSQWSISFPTASAGTVMLSALPIILGFQLLLAFFSYDMQSLPQFPLQQRLTQLESLKAYNKHTKTLL